MMFPKFWRDRKENIYFIDKKNNRLLNGLDTKKQHADYLNIRTLIEPNYEHS